MRRIQNAARVPPHTIVVLVLVLVLMLVLVLVLVLELVLVFLKARAADLGSLLADLGSLLGVSFGSWGGRLPAAPKNLKNSTSLQPQAFLAKQAAPVCARYTS